MPRTSFIIIVSTLAIVVIFALAACKTTDTQISPASVVEEGLVSPTTTKIPLVAEYCEVSPFEPYESEMPSSGAPFTGLYTGQWNLGPTEFTDPTEDWFIEVQMELGTDHRFICFAYGRSVNANGETVEPGSSAVTAVIIGNEMHFLTGAYSYVLTRYPDGRHMLKFSYQDGPWVESKTTQKVVIK